MSNTLQNIEQYLNDDEDTMKDQYLTFLVGDETFGFGIEYVTEIVGIQEVTKVPDMVSYVKGIINLRGSVIPVIDVRLRFGQQEREYDERTCIVVVQLEDLSVGLIVDTVNEVCDITEEQVSPPPAIYGGTGSQYLKGMGKLEDKVIIILDITRLLRESDEHLVRELEKEFL